MRSLRFTARGERSCPVRRYREAGIHRNCVSGRYFAQGPRLAGFREVGFGELCALFGLGEICVPHTQSHMPPHPSVVTCIDWQND